MRRILVSLFLLSLCISYSSAQQIDWDSITGECMAMIENDHPKEALLFWEENARQFENDSSYVWLCSDLSLILMVKGFMSEAEIMFSYADSALNSLKSDDPWWWDIYAYICTRKAMFYNLTHNYETARRYAVEAKISYEMHMTAKRSPKGMKM